MKVLSAIFLLGVNVLSQDSSSAESTGSLLGKPLTAITGSLEQYTIEVSQAKGQRVISTADAGYALEHSELIDSTLPEVRYNNFPLIATLHLIRRDHPTEVRTVHLCSLGIYEEHPITYVFRYHLPEASIVKPTGKNIVMASADFDAHAIAQKVKAGMDSSQVIEALGQPKDIKMEKNFTRWFYSYEFPDKSGSSKLMGLMIEFNNGKVAGTWIVGTSGMIHP